MKSKIADWLLEFLGSFNKWKFFLSRPYIVLVLQKQEVMVHLYYMGEM